MQLCSISLVTGLFICLRSATKITHRAQSITSLAAKWHACATINSFDDADGDTPVAQIVSPQMFSSGVDWGSEEEEDGNDDLDNTKLVPIFAHTISFQKRQALGQYKKKKNKKKSLFNLHTFCSIVLIRLLICVAVTYLEHNRAGITVYGFMVDRTGIQAIFAIELALLLWLLNKTIGTFFSPLHTHKERKYNLTHIKVYSPNSLPSFSQ